MTMTFSMMAVHGVKMVMVEIYQCLEHLIMLKPYSINVWNDSWL